MCLEIEAALARWKPDDDVRVVLIDAAGDRAFCAGGDISEMYHSGIRGDHSYGLRYWLDEYRLNAMMATWTKPIITFLHGFTMGGGVGTGCLASHRIVGRSSRIAMPECSIGLVPDTGGSWLLARAPGRLGECLALTGMRMNPGDAIHCGFADMYCEEETWPDLRSELCRTGDADLPSRHASDPPAGRLIGLHDEVNTIFSAPSLQTIMERLQSREDDFTSECLRSMKASSPISMHCALELVRRQRNTSHIRQALELEFRFTYRAAEHGDFIEGIRARIIDRGTDPVWKHSGLTSVETREVDAMLAPLEDVQLNWRK